jgi:hypothetical protein
LIFGIFIDGIERAIDLLLSNAFLAELGGVYSLGDLLMFMARFCPSESKLLVVDETSFLESIDSRLSYLIFNSTGFEVSEQLPLTLCTSN